MNSLVLARLMHGSVFDSFYWPFERSSAAWETAVAALVVAGGRARVGVAARPSGWPKRNRDFVWLAPGTGISGGRISHYDGAVRR